MNNENIVHFHVYNFELERYKPKSIIIIITLQINKHITYSINTHIHTERSVVHCIDLHVCHLQGSCKDRKICVLILGTLLSSLSSNSIIEQMYQNIIIITVYKTLGHAHRLAHPTPDQTELTCKLAAHGYIATTDLHLSGTVVSPQSHSSGQE